MASTCRPLDPRLGIRDSVSCSSCHALDGVDTQWAPTGSTARRPTGLFLLAGANYDLAAADRLLGPAVAQSLLVPSEFSVQISIRRVSVSPTSTQIWKSYSPVPFMAPTPLRNPQLPKGTRCLRRRRAHRPSSDPSRIGTRLRSTRVPIITPSRDVHQRQVMRSSPSGRLQRPSRPVLRVGIAARAT